MKKRLYLTGDPVLSEFIRKNPKKKPTRTCPCCKRKISYRLHSEIMSKTGFMLRAGIRMLNRGRSDCGMCGTPKGRRND